MKAAKFNILIHKKIASFNKTIRVDSDKSISIRSFLISSISENISKVKNVLESEDVFAAINCLKKLGVKIKKKRNAYFINGKGLGSLRAKKNIIINCGNSGTTARLLIGLLSTTPNIQVKITGDNSLNKRSMKKLIKIISKFGTIFLPKNKNTFPLTIKSSPFPIGIAYKAGISAQLKSAVILAGLNAHGITSIFENKKSRNHTENMLLKNSSVIKIKRVNKEKKLIKIYGKKSLVSQEINVSGDPSTAAFFTALTILTPKARLKIKDVGLNPRRIGFYKLLKKHGAKINFKKIKKVNNEIIGDIEVEYSKLRALKAKPEYYVSATDEYPILFIIAGLTKGVSVFKGIGDLANKESNRIEEMKKLLEQIGIKCKSDKNQMKIFGGYKIDYNSFVKVPALNDHRICMSQTILSLSTGIKSNIKNFETVRTSAPSFLKVIKSLGGQFEIKKVS